MADHPLLQPILDEIIGHRDYLATTIVSEGRNPYKHLWNRMTAYWAARADGRQDDAARAEAYARLYGDPRYDHTSDINGGPPGGLAIISRGSPRQWVRAMRLAVAMIAADEGEPWQAYPFGSGYEWDFDGMGGMIRVFKIGTRNADLAARLRNGGLGLGSSHETFLEMVTNPIAW